MRRHEAVRHARFLPGDHVLLDLLTPERILLSGPATGKREVLADLARLLAGGDAGLEAQILAGFVEREEVMSTGIGHGIALPHARLAAIDQIRLALARYPRGVPFKSLDERPIVIAFGVIGPPAEADRHVKVLARIARLVKRGDAVPQLLAAPTIDELRRILAQSDV